MKNFFNSTLAFIFTLLLLVVCVAGFIYGLFLMHEYSSKAIFYSVLICAVVLVLLYFASMDNVADKLRDTKDREPWGNVNN